MFLELVQRLDHPTRAQVIDHPKRAAPKCRKPDTEDRADVGVTRASHHPVGARHGSFIQHHMHEAFGDRMKPAASLARMLGATRLGRKNGLGFYRYKAGHKAGVDRSVYPLLAVRPTDEVEPELVEQRLLYAMLNEAAMACADRVVRSPRDADIGAIFGIGFPAFRGGPLRMIDDLGPAKVVETLYQLQEHFGERFRPAASLLEMSRSSERYYPA